MSGEGSEQRSGPAEAIVARRSSRPEMPGWLLKEGADEEDESGSEYDPAEELPEPDEEAAEYEVDGVVRGRVRLHGSKQSTSGLQVDDERRNSLAERKYLRSVVKRGVGPSGGDNIEACPGREGAAAGEGAGGAVQRWLPHDAKGDHELSRADGDEGEDGA